MKKKLVLIFFLLAACFQTALYGGMGTTINMNGHKIITVTKNDNGKEMSVKSGDEFKIELEELGSAGYGWNIDNLNKEHLELLSKETRVIYEGRAGSPAMGVWLFKAKKKGSTEIRMDLYRMWEGKEKAAEDFSIKLTIE
jgi:predicted secreted protein